MTSLRLWITRTQPQADETGDRLRELGHAPVVAPLLAVRPIPDADLDLTDAAVIAFTSRNAVAAFAAISPRRDLPVVATGAATAADARAAGFTNVRSAEGDVAALAVLLAGSRPGGVVIHPGAREPAGDLAGALAAAGIAVRGIAIYETFETGAPMPTPIDGVLVHSPRAARALAKVINDSKASTLTLYAISQAAAEPLDESKFRRVAVAPYPNEASLLSVIDG
ncbi:uroporphyrinogen-III synthase [soil metagenome]